MLAFRFFAAAISIEVAKWILIAVGCEQIYRENSSPLLSYAHKKPLVAFTESLQKALFVKVEEEQS